MVPPLGKITSFFKPYVAKKKGAATEEDFDGENITVAARPTVLPPTSQLNTLRRTISPRPSSKKSSENVAPPTTQISTTSKERSTPPPRDDHLNDDTSPLNTLSLSPSTLLSVRTTKLTQQPSIAIDKVVSPRDPRPTPSNAVTSSFSSTTSSRRVVVNGVKAVTDSDSDGISISSDDELEDVSSFMPRKRIRLTPPGADAAHAIVLQDTEEPPSKSKLGSSSRLSVPVAKKYRHSLLNLVKQVEQDEASKARIKQAEADVDQPNGSKADDAEQDANPDIDLFADDSDQERIKAALNRVEALERSDMFYFFHGTGNTQGQPPSPRWDSLAPLLNLESAREMAIRSGFLTDLAQQTGLPQDVLEWLYKSMQVEPSEMLCEEYLNILQAPSRCQPESVQRYLSLRSLYDGPTSTDKGSKQARYPPLEQLPRSLRYNLRLLASLAPGMTSSQERATLLVDLCLVNLDEHVRGSLDIQFLVEDALRAVLGSGSPDDRQALQQHAIGQILDHGLLSQQQMARAIALLPATTLELHQFRRQLALHHMLAASPHETISMTDLQMGDKLLAVLRDNPLFTVTYETNWALFHWTVHLLDICIDVGFSGFQFLDTKATTGIETQDEKLFNRQIDEFVQRLRLIANSIRDSGTSHLRRTEAKGVLDRLVARVELSVRTKPKAKAAVFGGKVGQQNLFKNFLSHVDSDEEDDGGFLRTQPKIAKKNQSTKSVKFEDVTGVLRRIDK